MANQNVNLPYNTPKQIRVSGMNASDTAEKQITNIQFTKSSATITLVATSDPLVYTATNMSSSVSGTGTIFWTAQNELGATISGQTPFTQVPPDPATHLVTTEQ